MKANLPQREPEMIKNWTEKGLYQKILKMNEGKTTFAMPDGPPYANGNLHMGHALNKILKDIVIKYKNLSGFYAPFIPGWDCHGLPIEQGVLKALGPEGKKKTDVEIRDLCRKEARKWVEIQREQFIRFGILGDWDNPYLTMDPGYEADEVRTLAKILDKGIFYRGEKPVYWCIPLQTALAEAEVEYHIHKSPSIYVKFPMKGRPEGINVPVSFVIWTTTPWTLPANVAIAVHPDFEYEFCLANDGKEAFVIAKALREFFEKETGVQVQSTGKVVSGKDLENIKCQHPFIDRESVVILGDHVTLEAGTGCVHTAPGHGQEDYKVGLQYGLPVLSPVDNAGKFTKDVPEYEGIGVFEANPKIVERLRESGHLIASKEIEHSYPHCWRTKTPLIFRATPQWFIRMDEGENSLRAQALDAIKSVNWVPKWGENRITGMIANRPDWCLSRQRTWGVPIPVFYCESCEHELADSRIMNRVADLMEKGGGIEAYHTHSVKEMVGGEHCSHCGHTEFRKGKDILDVWFDSGICWAAVQNRRKGLQTPADLYLEGSDQHRGWFHTSLLASQAATGKPPFKTVLTHGFVMFTKGQKMSKSLGNVVNPQDLIAKSGAEILRLWAAHEDYAQDLTCSPESFERVTETYRRLRNTMRFLLGNVGDFDPTKDSVPYTDLMNVDKWLLSKLNALVDDVHKAYEGYEFYKVYHLLNTFVTVELSSFYLDVLKDRLYTWKQKGVERRSAQTVLIHLLQTLTGLMAPICCFLAEETYQHIPGLKEESIFLTQFPKQKFEWHSKELEDQFQIIQVARSQVLVELEKLRQEKKIGANLEAEVTLSAASGQQGKEGSEKSMFGVLNLYSQELSTLFIVSKVNLIEGKILKVTKAEKSSGKKCARCWHYYDAAKENSKFPDACPKCVGALS